MGIRQGINSSFLGCEGEDQGESLPVSAGAPEDFGPHEAKKCLEACRQRFLFNKTGILDRDFSRDCTSLANLQPNKDLWELYCCDSNACGVYIDRTGQLGQSPNVDLVINQCQNHGFHSIIDPGPPPLSYECPPRTQRPLPCLRPNTSISPDGSTSVNAGFGIAVTSTQSPTATLASSSYTTQTTQVNPQAIPFSTMTAETPAATASETQKMGSSAGQLSPGAQAAITICSIVGLVAIIFVGVCCLRHRRKKRSSYGRARPIISHHGRMFSGPPSISNSPLISPTISASSNQRVATPPARLRDRAFLPPVSKTNGAISPLSRSESIASKFPASPICTPTLTKMYPRHERSVAKLRGLKQKSPAHLSHPEAVHLPRSSINSYSSDNPAPSLALSMTSGSATITGTPPHSPSRPTRPHDEPLEIPDLVAPSGPPPSRALPPPPPVSGPTALSPPPWPLRPVITNSPVQHGDVGVVAGVVNHNPAKGVRLESASKDLCELTEEYAQERGSWGSWSGAGGGGPGVTTIKKKKESTPRNSAEGTAAIVSHNSPGRKGSKAKELDLEILGGSY